MIALDTNVLVRFLTQDDEAQAKIATRVIHSLTSDDPGYVPIVVMAELGWMLSRSYRYSREQIADAVEALLRSND